jgi:UDP-N-acetylmuramyl pentapeptide synthase
LISKGKVIVKSFTHNEETAKYLIENVNPNSAVLLKASRCMKFEEIAEFLKKAGAK